MEKEILVKMVNDGLSTVQISDLVGKSKTTIRYWLKKYKLKTEHLSFREIGKIDYGNDKKCPRCSQKKSLSEFYQRRGKEAGSVYCKVCTNEQTIERQKIFKQLAIDYKGGVCVKCGYNRCNSALEFHHLNPNEKDFSLSQKKQTRFNDEIKRELDKCILVCANCHREIHSEHTPMV